MRKWILDVGYPGSEHPARDNEVIRAVGREPYNKSLDFGVRMMQFRFLFQRLANNAANRARYHLGVTSATRAIEDAKYVTVYKDTYDDPPIS